MTTAPTKEAGKTEVATFQPPRLPYHAAIEERFGIKAAEWKALVEAVFPAAKTVDAIVLALSYCKARKLDPFKRVVHIVPIWDKEKRAYTETVWPGIAEHRTTAFRTGAYAGADACAFGPMVDKVFESASDDGTRRNVAVKFPEWAQLTVYRLIEGQRVPVPGPKVYWTETYSRLGRSPVPNDMWQKRPVGQLEKCAEAAALRRAFPEELGDEHTSDEAGAIHIGAENAKDITPRPTRESVEEAAQAKEAKATFTVVTIEGEPIEHESAEAAAKAILGALEDGAQRGGLKGLEGMWESNAVTVGALREAGHGVLADELQARFTALGQETGKPAAAKDKEKAAEGKPAGAGAPQAAVPADPLTLKGKAQGEAWEPFCTWLKRTLMKADAEGRKALSQTYAEHLRRIAEIRIADHDAIQAILSA